MAKIVGLTGGIGSGKTTVANMFHDLGVPVYIADIQAKKITNYPETLQKIQDQFGSNMVLNGTLNRAAMANVVFNNPEKLSQLNAIIHPLVAKDFAAWIEKNKKERFVIKETAILFETNNHLTCDFVITVTAPIEIRIKRVLERDQTTVEEVRNRINSQWTDEQRVALSDFVIKNDHLAETMEQVRKVYQKIVEKL